MKLWDSCGIVGWIGTLVLGALREFTSFVPLGMGVALVIPTGSGRLRRLSINLPALAVGSVLTILACVARNAGSRHPVAIVDLALPLLGCLFGAWAGTACLGGWRPCLLLLRNVTLSTSLIVLCLGGVLWVSLEDTPWPWDAVPVSSADKQRLTQLARSKSPTSLKEGQTHTLQLTEHDVNVLLSWSSSFESLKRKARVRLDRDSISLLMSWPARLGDGKPRYLNLGVAGSARIEDGILRLRMDHGQVGSLELPHWLLRRLGPLATAFLNHDRRVKPFLKATTQMVIEPDSIRLTYGALDLPTTLRERLFHPSPASEELRAAARAQVDHLLLLFATSRPPDPPPSFNLCIKTAFALARNRSTQHSAVLENQAAIFALGILLGHPGIEDFLGPVVSDGDREEARRIRTRVVLHGRSDWTRHFFVSAVIAILSDEAISDACGLLKEELDTHAGGSGFSFADLLVDRAGTAFGVRATRDAATARALQDRLIRGFRTEDLCPQADDLPEGVSEADLQWHYGGVGGYGYRRLVEEIEHRVAACAVYR